MKKILFVCYSLKVGGIERALVEQVNDLAQHGEDVTLYLFSKNGPYLSEVDNNVKIIGNLFLFKYLSLTQKEAREKGTFAFLIRSIFAVIVKVIGFPRLWKMLRPFISTIGAYDIAIAYTQNLSLKSLYCGCPEFVLDKVKAQRKIAWLHADYQRAQLANEYNNALISRFDKVVNVTACMKRKFDTLHLIAKEKSDYVYNRFSAKQIIQKAKLYDVSYNDNVLNIVSVCRLEKEKGVDQLFQLANHLSKKGLRFCWYFVGTGVLNDWCLDYITQNQLADKVKLVGQKSNPYPYVQAAHLFVSGSLSETFGISILEALVLGVPTIAYRYDAIDEVLNESNGYVADSFKDMQETIEKLISDKSFYEQLKDKSHILIDYNDQNAIQMKKIL